MAFANGPHRQKGDPPAPFLRRFAVDVAAPILAGELSADRVDLERADLRARAVLIADHSDSDSWWWKGPPKSRDLAVLSLLAGNWPDSSETTAELTVARVIAAEERAINRWRDKWDIEWRKRKRRA